MRTVIVTWTFVTSLFIVSCVKDIPTPTTTYPLSSTAVGESIDTNNFSFGATELKNISDSKSYSLYYNLPVVEVFLGGMLSSGSIDVEIKKEDGTSVYSKSLSGVIGHSQELSFDEGMYTIDLSFDNATGNVGIDVEAEE